MSVSGYTWALTPKSSKQRCCSAVGSLCMVNVAPLCTICTRFAVSVPQLAHQAAKAVYRQTVVGALARRLPVCRR